MLRLSWTVAYVGLNFNSTLIWSKSKLYRYRVGIHRIYALEVSFYNISCGFYAQNENHFAGADFVIIVSYCLYIVKEVANSTAAFKSHC